MQLPVERHYVFELWFRQWISTVQKDRPVPADRINGRGLA